MSILIIDKQNLPLNAPSHYMLDYSGYVYASLARHGIYNMFVLR